MSHYNNKPIVNGNLRDSSGHDYVPTPSHIPRRHISNGPVSRIKGSIDLIRHPWSVIIEGSPVVHHFSNRECAEATATYLLHAESGHLGFFGFKWVTLHNRLDNHTYERVAGNWVERQK